MYFVVQIEGNNVLLSDWAKKTLGHVAETAPSLGFYTTRVVSADSEQQAIEKAIASVEDELRTTNVVAPIVNDLSNPLIYRVSHIRQSDKPVTGVPTQGFSFFPEGTNQSDD